MNAGDDDFGAHAKNVHRMLHDDVTPHAVLSYLNEKLPDIAEIYIVIKDKEGNWSHTICGNLAGVSFSTLILHDVALKTL